MFLHLFVKSEIEEQRSHKVVTAISIEFDLLLLVSLQCSTSILSCCPSFYSYTLSSSNCILSCCTDCKVINLVPLLLFLAAVLQVQFFYLALLFLFS